MCASFVPNLLPFERCASLLFIRLERHALERWERFSFLAARSCHWERKELYGWNLAYGSLCFPSRLGKEQICDTGCRFDSTQPLRHLEAHRMVSLPVCSASQACPVWIIVVGAVMRVLHGDDSSTGALHAPLDWQRVIDDRRTRSYFPQVNKCPGGTDPLIWSSPSTDKASWTSPPPISPPSADASGAARDCIKAASVMSPHHKVWLPNASREEVGRL
ncbi:hypothetical protein K431DRAFT_73659 [Polychaeton citri CBS 116435]|uniref:Uncharacterized protein n=1 Tax=Polychaeton citri CBS 116435 TaxID=1314669 RepID=A0A9P4Q8H1_9PEZI|nr:hypothetical protein K431DRAFT_73659 [Polychaeton citri CBS 116435]